MLKATWRTLQERVPEPSDGATNPPLCAASRTPVYGIHGFLSTLAGPCAVVCDTSVESMITMRIKSWRSVVEDLLESVRGRPRYRSLSSDGEDPKSGAWQYGTTQKRSYKGIALFAVVVAIFFSFLISLYSPSSLPFHQSDPSTPRHFRILIPASKSDANLCKTFLSTSILGYPAPVLINWGKSFNEANDVFGGSHLAKITGVLRYLDNLASRYDDDLVLFMDGYDMWFQLRPEVLLERYNNIVKRQTKRLEKTIGKRIMNKEGIFQSIIFSAQKRCWPKEAEHPACFAVPESELPRNVYGGATDTDVHDPQNPYLKFRQAYLNSGAAIGPVKDMRRLFRRAYEEMLIDRGFGSDQAIFAAILGKQEFQREVIRQRNRSLFRSLVDRFSGRVDFLDPKTDPNHWMMPHFKGAPWEFGLGLDYLGELTFPTVWSEWDTAWISYDDTKLRHEISKEWNVSPYDKPFPKDISRSRGPFDTLGVTTAADSLPPKGTAWERVPLFTNLWTGVIPVAAHHNAMRFGLKSRLQTHWNRTWYQPFARGLLRSHILEPHGAFAMVQEEGVEREYWGTSIERGGVTTDTNDYIPYGFLCPLTEEEIFRDGKGPWMDPYVYEHRPPLA